MAKGEKSSLEKRSCCGRRRGGTWVGTVFFVGGKKCVVVVVVVVVVVEDLKEDLNLRQYHVYTVWEQDSFFPYHLLEVNFQILNHSNSTQL